MSTKNGGRKPPRRTYRGRTKDRNEIGYCKPPRAHQFKPGQSGNPKGRPKGANNEATIITNLLNRKLMIQEGGRPRKRTVMAVMLMKCVEAAMKGNLKALVLLLNKYAALKAAREAKQVALITSEMSPAEALKLYEATRKEGMPVDFEHE